MTWRQAGGNPLIELMMITPYMAPLDHSLFTLSSLKIHSWNLHCELYKGGYLSINNLILFIVFIYFIWIENFGECHPGSFNTLRPRQNGRHFADDIFKCIFLNENVWIPNKISLKFVLKGPINDIPALVQIMAWRRPGDKPLSEPMLVSLPTHICVTRPQWVNAFSIYKTLSMVGSLYQLCSTRTNKSRKGLLC